MCLELIGRQLELHFSYLFYEFTLLVPGLDYQLLLHFLRLRLAERQMTALFAFAISSGTIGQTITLRKLLLLVQRAMLFFTVNNLGRVLVIKLIVCFLFQFSLLV